LEGEEIHIDIEMDVEEIDGSWNWLYFGYSHTESKLTAAYKGAKSDLKAILRNSVSHDSPSSLKF